MDNKQKIRRVVIAGGGTAGWMTAAAICKLIGKDLDVTLVESEDIGTVGVGEATIPTLHIFHQLLGLHEADIMAYTNATFKLGIKFEDWFQKQHEYLHSFGHLGQDCWAAPFHHFWLRGTQLGVDRPIGDYCTEHLAAREQRFAVKNNQQRNHAYHLDATKYAALMRKLAERYGVTRIEGKIHDIKLDEKNGFIQALELASGELVSGDLFIDCTGFHALLIEGALHTGYHDWSNYLPCDRAYAVQTNNTEAPLPYTRSIARDAGWQWKIPLQTRTGNGLVYCRRYLDDETARQFLLDNIEGEVINEPRLIKFKTGTRRQHWNKNCIAIGLSSGFIEPLESTSIHLIQRSIIRLLLLFPKTEIEPSAVEEFNLRTKMEVDNIRDFIILHYHATERNDSKFWHYCRSMPIPESLQHRMELFRTIGNVYKYDDELFSESSWVQVMMGQGISPASYHNIVDLMSENELKAFLDKNLKKVQQEVEQMPNHLAFIEKYCKTPHQ